MVRLRCQRCKHVWQYRGKKKWYCTCPDCKTSVQVKQGKRGKGLNKART